MSTNIEIEAKSLVNEKDYLKFIKHFKINEKDYYLQTNYYIDDSKFSLINYGISLRIRKKKTSYEMTLKTPLSEGLLEKNQLLDLKEFNDFKKDKVFPEGDIKRFLTMLGFDLNSLYIITDLTTKRADINYENGLLSLDENTYNGKKDFEIEFEYNSKSGAIKVMTDLFKKLNVTFKENKISKVRRAYLTVK